MVCNEGGYSAKVLVLGSVPLTHRPDCEQLHVVEYIVDRHSTSLRWKRGAKKGIKGDNRLGQRLMDKNRRKKDLDRALVCPVSHAEDKGIYALLHLLALCMMGISTGESDRA